MLIMECFLVKINVLKTGTTLIKLLKQEAFQTHIQDDYNSFHKTDSKIL